MQYLHIRQTESDDIDSICLIRECRDLEQHFHSNFTEAILQREADTCPHPREIKKDILSRDRDLRLAQYEVGQICPPLLKWKGPLVGPDYGILRWTMAQSALMASETW